MICIFYSSFILVLCLSLFIFFIVLNLSLNKKKIEKIIYDKLLLMILLHVASKTFHSAIIVTCTLCTVIVLQTINSLLMVSGHKKKFTHHKIKIKNKVCTFGQGQFINLVWTLSCTHVDWLLLTGLPEKSKQQVCPEISPGGSLSKGFKVPSLSSGN